MRSYMQKYRKLTYHAIHVVGCLIGTGYNEQEGGLQLVITKICAQYKRKY